MSPRSTPEEAARGDIPAKFVRVVGGVVRGNQAVVAQLTNDGPVYEIETAHCLREKDGWVEERSGNGNAGFLPTGNGTGTLVIWDQAPAWAVAARYEFRGHERVVPVNNGIVPPRSTTPQRSLGTPSTRGPGWRRGSMRMESIERLSS